MKSAMRRRKGAGWFLAVACALLFFGSPAEGMLGVDTYWGSIEFKTNGSEESTGGRFARNGANGVAVNDPGIVDGNGADGDVYVADTGFNRVQQFDPDGNFIRAWGFDVEAPAASPASSATFEVCTVKTSCQPGATAVAPAPGGELSAPTGIAVNQTTGHVYLNDRAFNRIQEFTASGVFVRAFGQDVVSAGPGNAGTGYEICVAANGDTCKAGTSTGNAAGVVSSPGAENLPAGYVAVAPAGAPNAGDLLLPDPTRSRVQEFTANGGFVRAFGGGVVNGGAEGTGNLNGTTTISAVKATKKAFSIGQVITSPGGGIPAGTTITAVTTGATATITLSQAATKSESNASLVVAEGAGNVPNNEQQVVTLGANTTGGTFTITMPATQGFAAAPATIEWNASPGAVQTALENLLPIGVGNVAVTSPNPGGGGVVGGPYTIEFIGKFADTNVANLTTSATNLVVSEGTKSALRTTLVEGASGFETCTSPAECQGGTAGSGSGQFAASTPTRAAEDSGGHIYTVEHQGSFRVQRFTLPGNVPTAGGTFDCAELCGTQLGNNRDNPVDVAVDEQGFVYVAKAFSEGTGVPLVPLGGFSGSEGFQERVLKVDPAGNGGSGQVVETINANTGREPIGEGKLGGAVIKGVSGLAAPASGQPLYLANSSLIAGSQSRVYRFDQISGPSGSVSTGTVGATAVTLDATIAPAATLGPVKTLYHFEYRREGTTAWIASPSSDVSIGNGSAGGESNECSDLLQAATCHLSGEIDGLELDRTYQYRLVARTSYLGAVFTTAPQEFTTVAVPPSVSTGGAVWSGPPDTGPSLTFSGRVNPQGAGTKYAFEYVDEAEFGATGFAGAQSVPAAAISAGHGTKTLDVVVVKAGLDPSSAYRFRLVATNPSGTSVGEVGSVAPAEAGDRFLELVSEGDSQGGSVNRQITVSDDGERVAFTAITFGDDQQAAPWITIPAIAQREEGSGWTAKVVAGDPFADASGTLAAFGGTGDADVTERFWGTRPVPQTVQYAVRTLDGALSPITPVLSPLDRSGFFSLDFLGGSRDLDTFVLTNGPSPSTLFPGEPLLQAGASNLYKVTGAGTGSPGVSLLNRADGGGTIGGACGAILGSGTNSIAGTRTNAVSADGSVAYFSARAGTPAAGFCTTAQPLRIFKRVGDASAVEISACGKTPPATCTASGDDSYLGASADGSRVFFSTSRQLTDSDADSTADLYLYDSSPPASQPNLVQASAGELVPGANPGDPPAHETGKGAEAQGVVDFAMGGSRVYFVAKGRLTAGGSAGANNLYVFQRDAAHPLGRVGFVAVLGSGVDPRLWLSASNATGGGRPAYALPRYQGAGGSRVDGDGHLLVFVSSQPLLAEDQDSANDVYRYDDETGGLECLSCAGDTAEPAAIIGRDVAQANPDQIQRERVASEDGSEVAFSTRDPLLPAEDTNTVEDVYLWDDGTLKLISGATGDVGAAHLEELGGGPAVSPDGKSVFFLTRATLLPQDLDNGARDVYAARIDGGFPQQELAQECSSEESCQPPPPPPPPPPPVGSSSPGPPNVVQPTCAKNQVLRGGRCVRRCPAKRVLRHGRCVKPKHKARKHRQSQDGTGRRAGR